MWNTVFAIFVTLVQTLIILAYVYKAFAYLSKETGWHNPLAK